MNGGTVSRKIESIEHMNLEKYLVVGGAPGVHKLVTSRGNGLIIEDRLEGRTRFVPTRGQQVTPLSTVAVYTYSDEEGESTIPLTDVFQRMLDQLETTPPVSAKAASDELRAYFSTVVPEHDRDRVHINDIKKCVKWFTFMVEKGIFEEAKRAEEKAAAAEKAAMAENEIAEDASAVAVAEETNAVAVAEETDAVAVAEETNAVAVAEETDVVAVAEETDAVAVAEETNAVAVAEETDVVAVAVAEETDAVAVAEETDAVAVAETPEVLQTEASAPAVKKVKGKK